MKKYCPIYVPVFQKRLQQYSNLKQRVKNRVIAILENPYSRTEPLERELKGLRSAKISRNFRIIFAISEEIKKINIARVNFPQFCKYPDDIAIFITLGPHDKAYKLK